MIRSHGKSWGSMTVFLKQYGEKRTGTNVLRALLQAHYADVTVLMHVLGDKHSPPSPLADIYRTAASAADFVCEATQARLPSLTAADDRARSALLAAVEDGLADSYQSGKLGFLISVKHPYAWLVSLRRFAALDPQSPAPDAAAAGMRYNANYRSWFALRAEYGSRVAVVRHEDLLADPSGTVGGLAEAFRLRRLTAGPLRLPAGIVVPARWDHMRSTTAAVAFDGGYYRRREYLDAISEQDRRVLRSAIDWGQLAPYGYRDEGLEWR